MPGLALLIFHAINENEQGKGTDPVPFNESTDGMLSRKKT